MEQCKESGQSLNSDNFKEDDNENTFSDLSTNVSWEK